MSWLLKTLVFAQKCCFPMLNTYDFFGQEWPGWANRGLIQKEDVLRTAVD